MATVLVLDDPFHDGERPFNAVTALIAAVLLGRGERAGAELRQRQVPR